MRDTMRQELENWATWNRQGGHKGVTLRRVWGEATFKADLLAAHKTIPREWRLRLESSLKVAGGALARTLQTVQGEVVEISGSFFLLPGDWIREGGHAVAWHY